MKTLYIDSIEGFTFQGSYDSDGQIRNVYAAPLPYLALIFVRDRELWQYLHQYVDINIGWANRRGDNESKCSFGHIPGELQTKITIRRALDAIACPRLSEVIRQAPQYKGEVNDYVLHSR